MLFLTINSTDVKVDIPKKVDITDWVEAYSQVSTNELISRLERAITVAAEKQEKESQKQEEEKHPVFIPSWSQLEIADYPA